VTQNSESNKSKACTQQAGTRWYAHLGAVSALAQQTPEIFCKTPSGRTITLEVEPSDSIEEVKRKFEDNEGIPACKLRLSFQGRHLKDARTLAEYEVKRESCVQMGGSGPAAHHRPDAGGHHDHREHHPRVAAVGHRRGSQAKHPGMLKTANNLATSLSSQGKNAEAEEMQRAVLVLQKRVLEAEHPGTMTTAHNLATSLFDQGKYAEAEEMQREVLAVRKRVLGWCAFVCQGFDRARRFYWPGQKGWPLSWWCAFVCRGFDRR